MKILIPVDFSTQSKVAIRYAVGMAGIVNAKLTMLNVVYIAAPPRAMLKAGDLEDAMVETAKQDCEDVIAEIKQKETGKFTINYEVVRGYPLDEIVSKFAVASGSSFIVMGTHGASGIKKIFMGSNATGVINRSTIPVITVPEKAKFSPPKNIVYASDMKNLDKEIKTVVQFAKLFDSTIHILHIEMPDSDIVHDAKEITARLIAKTHYPKIMFHLTGEENIIKGIDKYIGAVKADMLAMFTHNISFYEKLIGVSATQEMAFHSRVPLVSFKKPG